MKKELLAISTALFLLGCGEVEDKENTTTYDFWDYRVSDNNITKQYNIKVFINGYLNNTSSFVYTLNESYENTDKVKVNVDGTNLTITKYDSYIDNNATIEQRYIKRGDIVRDNCVLHNHYDIYNPTNDVEFEDVLQLKCEDDNYDNAYINYSKEFGNIGYVLVDGNTSILSYYNTIDNYKIDGAF